MDHMATREQIKGIENLIERRENGLLRWLIGTLVTVALGMALVIIRSLFP